MSDPILDLTTDISPRLWIRDKAGKPHNILYFSDLGLRARAELMSNQTRIDELLQKPFESITDEDDAEFLARYVRMVEILIPDMIGEVEDRFDPEQREAVVQAFFSNRVVRKLAARLTHIFTANQSNGEPSSPSSEPDTVEASTNG